MDSDNNMSGGDMEWSGESPFVTGGNVWSSVSDAVRNPNNKSRLVLSIKALNEVILLLSVLFLCFTVWVSDSTDTKLVKITSAFVFCSIVALNLLDVTQRVLPGNDIAAGAAGLVPLVGSLMAVVGIAN